MNRDGKGGKHRLNKRHGNSIKYKDKGHKGTGSQTHLWVMGLMIMDNGARIPLPRCSYYAKNYAQKHGLTYRSLVDLVVEMLHDLSVPENIQIVVVVDSFLKAKN